jgi:hypothetical protein
MTISLPNINEKMTLNQIKQPKNQQLSFKAYYDLKKQEVLIFRDEICYLLGISVETFYRKMKTDAWSIAEKTLISQHIGIEREILFPNKTV